MPHLAKVSETGHWLLRAYACHLRPVEPVAEENTTVTDENTPVAEITENDNNHEPENNVHTETEVAVIHNDDTSTDEQPEIKKPDFSRPANTFEYKG